jgi:hypothetical protein
VAPQVVEHLPSKYKALSSNPPSNTKKNSLNKSEVVLESGFLSFSSLGFAHNAFVFSLFFSSFLNLYFIAHNVLKIIFFPTSF